MTSSDFLKIALGSGFIVLVIFICVLLSHLITTLRDINRITARANDITDKVHRAVIAPLKALSLVGDKVKEFIESKLHQSEEDDDDKK